MLATLEKNRKSDFEEIEPRKNEGESRISNIFFVRSRFRGYSKSKMETKLDLYHARAYLYPK